MYGFSGFPAGKLRTTALPNLFFSEILPHIDHLAELKVTLYSFWAMSQQDRPIRYLKLTDFMQDAVLMDGLGKNPKQAANALLDGLERATARGVLLHVSIESGDGQTELYFLNSPKGRSAVESIEQGEWRPALGREESPVNLYVERPNIFVLYEQNIGVLTPLIAEELRSAEREYPAKWLEDAVSLAVQNNKRNWRYVQAILRNWQTQGKEEVTRQHPSSGPQRGARHDEFFDY